jgi:predicted DsbA family dithiol-disulfide isomerase
MPVRIEVYSDVVCPWCFVGKRRFEAALQAIDGRDAFAVVWRPFELNPDMPREGMDRRAYRTAKFGSLERSRALDARLEAVGATAGIDFAFERIARTPNTFDAHRLIDFAQREGAGDAVVEALFRRYFEGGEDVGRPEVLLDVAGAAGLDAGAVRRMLEGDAGAAGVRAAEGEAWRLGITGVPMVVIDGQPRIAGAQDPGTVAAVLPIPEDVAAELPKSGVARVIVLTNGQTDDVEWRRGAYEQFMRDDSPEDEIYSTLR